MIKPEEQLVKILIKKHVLTHEDLALAKKKFSRDTGALIYSNIQLIKAYRNLRKLGKIKERAGFERFLTRAKVRSLSGVVPIAILTKPYKCPGKCIYCPNEKSMPKSYLAKEPAVMRAVLADFSPSRQIEFRLKGLKASGHKTDKVELIIMGGSWSALPEEYQYQYILDCFRKFNGSHVSFWQAKRVQNQDSGQAGMTQKKYLSYLKAELIKEQQKNERAKTRVVGLVLETRPDLITEKEIIKMRELGCTKVEIGVQNIDNKILKRVKRGHGVEEITRATKLLKDAGLKVGYHLMPGLPGATPKSDLEMIKKVFSDSRFQPDFIKIYPCVVTKYSKLEKEYKADKYKPYTDKQLFELITQIKKILPSYVRVSRLGRDIPAEYIVAGSKLSNIRQLVKEKYGEICQCIRCREIKDQLKIENCKLKIDRIDYEASGGREIFLQYIDDNNRLYSLLRLRIPSLFWGAQRLQNHDSGQARMTNKAHYIPVLKNAAIIREVHTYGQLVPVGEKNKKASQHKGLGEKLIAEAEKITKKEFGLKKIAVTAGVGVRGYYRRLGYKLADLGYMTKSL